MREVSVMREIWTRCVLVVGMGLAVVLAQGCRQQPKVGPAQTGDTVPQAAPAPRTMPVPEAAPVEVTPVVRSRRRRGPTRRPVEVPSQIPNGVDADGQRAQDQSLLQRQQAEARKIQKENDLDVQRDVEQKKRMQEEPRIQSAPEAPSQPGIQDAPEAPPQPRIQDAPGPVQPQTPPQ